MPLRFIHVSTLGRLTNLIAAPSSSDPDTHEAGLDAYRRIGGNCLHLHGEGGETHSRQAVGEWLRQRGFREEFFLCTQICHDAWDEANSVAVSRFHAEAVQEDIAADLELIGTASLDLVYLDDAPGQAFEPVVEAMGEAVRQGRIRAWGVRNWSPERIRAANTYAVGAGAPGISAVVTTELSLLRSMSPLWPEYLPFDAAMRQVVLDLGLAVFAHFGDLTTGQGLFGEPPSTLQGRWGRRWEDTANAGIFDRVRKMAGLRQVSAVAVNAGYLLSEPFPVVGIVGLSSFLTDEGAELERGSNLLLGEEEREFLRG